MKEQDFIPHISLGRVEPKNIQNFEKKELSDLSSLKISGMKLLLFESKSKSILL